MTVSVEPGATPKIGKPETLFMPPGDAVGWDVAKDASRFLLLTNQGEYVAPPFTVLLNWQSSLSR
jgi:hypothetical protein